MVRKRDGGMTKTGTIACAALALALTLLLHFMRDFENEKAPWLSES